MCKHDTMGRHCAEGALSEQAATRLGREIKLEHAVYNCRAAWGALGANADTARAADMRHAPHLGGGCSRKLVRAVVRRTANLICC